MKAVINVRGELFLERRGRMDTVLCPYKHEPPPFKGGSWPCGDWCALFGEPVQSMGMVGEEWVPINEHSLALCNNRHIHGEIIDQREGGE